MKAKAPIINSSRSSTGVEQEGRIQADSTDVVDPPKEIDDSGEFSFLSVSHAHVHKVIGPVTCQTL